MNQSLVRTIQSPAVRTDKDSMRFNNRERFALLLGFLWWIVLGYYIIPPIFRWIVAWLFLG